MNDLDLLTDDHGFLSSQVIHVVALHRAFIEGKFEAAPLQAELRQKAQLLGQQLAEHFAFEESIAFVRFGQLFPDITSTLQALLLEHDGILEAFEEFCLDLNLERNQMARLDSPSKAARFVSRFEQHATRETQLFEKLGLRTQRLL